MTNLICAGFGGQGVLTAGLIIAKTGMDLGRHVVWLPSYGSEMRGGTANCSVKLSEEEIASPFIHTIDVLLAMNAPSVDKFEEKVAPKGIMIINTSIIKNRKFREDIQVYGVDASGLASRLDHPRGTNIVMIGACMRATCMFGKEEMKEGIRDFFRSKGKDKTENQACFEAGYQSLGVVGREAEE